MAKKGAYYGKKEIVDIIESDDLSTDREKKAGRENVKLLFKDGTSEIIRKKMVKFAVSEEPLANDLTELRENRCKPVLAEILEVLLDYDIKPNDPMNELEYIIVTLSQSHEVNFKKAVETVWGVKNEDIKFSDIDKALRNEQKQ